MKAKLIKPDLEIFLCHFSKLDSRCLWDSKMGKDYVRFSPTFIKHLFNVSFKITNDAFMKGLLSLSESEKALVDITQILIDPNKLVSIERLVNGGVLLNTPVDPYLSMLYGFVKNCIPLLNLKERKYFIGEVSWLERYYVMDKWLVNDLSES